MKKLLLILMIFAVGILYILINKDKATVDPPIIKKKPNFAPTALSISQIFAEDHSRTATVSAQKKITLIATGDVLPARSVNFQALMRKDFTWPYLKTADFTKSADIAFINLETPFVEDCPVTQQGMIFCSDPKNIEGLVFAGVDIASLANNHTANYGEKNVFQTVNLLYKNAILTTGIAGPQFLEVKGVKFAFLGYNDISVPQFGISNVDEQKIKIEIAHAKSLADIVIVAFHWGTEYRNQPDERQKYLAHLAIDAGADLIIGNHPHWIQPTEIYKSKLITYAHGNFVFDQMWSQKTREGVVGRYTFYDKSLIDVEFFPIQIDDYGQPHFLSGPDKERILKEMQNESLNLVRYYK